MPLFPRDVRPPSHIGRTARLELAFERRRGRTVIAHAYAEPPFRIGRAFAIDDAAYVIVVCSGPGIFAGDDLRQTVRVGAGARAVLTSQSALQIHPADAAAASVRHEYTVDEGAELHCHWDPIIPFTGAAIAQRFTLNVAPTGRLYWSDAVMSGRVRRGERWRFHMLQHELDLRAGGVLKYLERYKLEPDVRDVRGRWIADDADYLATALVHDARATADIAEALQHELGGIAAITAGVDLVDRDVIVSRLIGSDGARFARARTTFRCAVLRTVFDSPALAGRK